MEKFFCYIILSKNITGFRRLPAARPEAGYVIYFFYEMEKEGHGKQPGT